MLCCTKDVPRSLLPLITSLLSSYEVSRLWLCGNSKLNLGLQTGGITLFDHSADTFHINRFPVLLRQLPSVKRVLINYEAYSKTYSPLLQWSCFPDGLESLEITITRQATIRDLLRDSTNPIVTDLSEVMSPNCPVNLESSGLRRFRNLTILKGVFSSLTSLDELPRSLSILDELRWSSLNLVGTLPPSLTSLGIELHKEFSDWRLLFGMLPQLEALRISSSLFIFDNVTLEDWRALPRTLRDCEWKTRICNSPRMGVHYPRSTTPANSISCEENLQLLLESLPIHLKRLSVEPFYAHVPFPTNIPPTLEMLDGASFQASEAEQFREIPRSLTTLCGASVKVNMVPHLPSKVTRLNVFGSLDQHALLRELEVLRGRADFDRTLSLEAQMQLVAAPHIANAFTALQYLRQLPLKSLYLDLWHHPIPQLRSALPTSLEYLYLFRRTDMPSAALALDNTTLAHLFGEASTAVPPHFPRLLEVDTSLNISEHTAAKQFPRSLTKLNFGGFVPTSTDAVATPCNEFWSSWLPRGLVRWRVISHPIESIQQASRSPVGGIIETMSLHWQHVLPAWYAHLPPALVRFEVSTSHFGPLQMKALATTCTGLRILKLSVFTQLLVQWLEELTDQLPTGLIRFYLMASGPARLVYPPGGESAEYRLPKIFDNLREHDDEEDPLAPSPRDIPMNITDEAFGRLPRGLKHLKFSATFFKIQEVSPLPDNAPRFLSFSSCDVDRVTDRPSLSHL